jgi:hypothetical protein
MTVVPPSVRSWSRERPQPVLARRETYRQLVAAGALPAGYATEDAIIPRLI